MTDNATGTPDIGSGTANTNATDTANINTQNATDTPTLEQKELRQGGGAVSKPNPIPWNKDPMDALEDELKK